MRNKILNFFLSIIVILIVIIFCIVYYYIFNNKAEISIYHELQTENNINEEIEETSIEDIEVLNFESSQIQKIYPFTGAFPSIDIMSIMQEDGALVQDLSNEQILRLAWAKVTKEDWAASYTGEGNPLSIKAELLDKYVKDIFGNIQYEKQDFSNREYKVDNSENFTFHTNSYEVKYDASTDTYIAQHVPGDGIGETRVALPSVTAIEYDDEIKIDIKTVIVVPEEVLEQDEITGEDKYYFNYKVYDRYDTVTKTLGKELMQYKETEISSEVEQNQIYKDLNLSDLNTISLIYKLDKDTGEYILKEIKK